MAEIVVFVGPTISAGEALQHLDALYLPPVGQGDVVRAVLDHAPAVIAIIDGVFGQRPAVRHKEILWAMARGVRVYGAASMGALRAAELAGHGMIGHGLIYRWYRRMPLADDADVAVAMAPAELGSQAMGEALVDIRRTLKKAEREGIINREFRVSLEAAARSLHFIERSYKTILSSCDSAKITPEEIQYFKTCLENYAVRQKKIDAIELLDALSLCRYASDTPQGDIIFELTDAFAFDLKYSKLYHEMFSEDLY